MQDAYRKTQIEDFLNEHLCKGTYKVLDMNLDASSRKYFRVVLNNGDTKILVDDKGCNNRPKEFAELSQFFNERGIKAPNVYVNDLQYGLMLVEDFGDSDFVKKVTKDNEFDLLRKAVDVLVKLHKVSDRPLCVKDMDEKIILDNFALFTDWYIPACLGKQLDSQKRKEFFDIVKKLMPRAFNLPFRVVLWDYHINNVMYPDNGDAAVIDFQDAMWGPGLYDLVSLIEDERRDIPVATTMKLKDYYLEKLSVFNKKDFEETYNYMALLRHMRVLGRFTTLILVNNRPQYANYIPHALVLLKRSLENPEFKELKQWMDVNFPESKWGKPKNKSIEKAFVLAAGRGTRMRHLTENTAKPMVTVAGRELIDYGLDLLRNSRIKDIVVNVCWCKDGVKKYISEQQYFNATISEEEEALETGGGIKKALGYFDNKPFVVVNADNILIDNGYKPIVRQMQDVWNDKKHDIVLLLRRKEGIFGDKPNYGDYKIEGETIVRNKDKQNADGFDFVYLGVAIIHPRIFNGCNKEKFSLVELFDKAQESGRLGFALSDRDEFLVGTPEAVEEAEVVLNKKINP